MSHSPTPRQNFRAVPVLPGYFFSVAGRVKTGVHMSGEDPRRGGCGFELQTILWNLRKLCRCTLGNARSCQGQAADSCHYLHFAVAERKTTRQTFASEPSPVSLTWWRDDRRLCLDVAPVRWDWLHLAQISLPWPSASNYQQLLWAPAWLLWLWSCVNAVLLGSRWGLPGSQQHAATYQGVSKRPQNPPQKSFPIPNTKSQQFQFLLFFFGQDVHTFLQPPSLELTENYIL